jgi:hypothetical protein
MIQGAANYAWNLIEEAWAMIWKQSGTPQAQAACAGTERKQQSDGEMREVGSDFAASKTLQHDPVLQHHQAG